MGEFHSSVQGIGTKSRGTIQASRSIDPECDSPTHGQSFSRLGPQAAPSSPPGLPTTNPEMQICWSRDPKPRVPLIPANPQATKSPNPNTSPQLARATLTVANAAFEARHTGDLLPQQRLHLQPVHHNTPGSGAAVEATRCTLHSSCSCSRSTTASSQQIPWSIIPRTEKFPPLPLQKQNPDGETSLPASPAPHPRSFREKIVALQSRDELLDRLVVIHPGK